jgi:glutamate N-acetyltransferase/amino-acid N-acetyltransferase
VIRGFRFGGVAAGIKKRGGPDLAVIVADAPAACAGVFTTNKVTAAPVVLSRQHLAATGRARAVIVNSGCANACTGPQGLADAERTTALVAEALGARPAEIQVCSTGVIGAPLPMAKLEAGIPAVLAAAREDGLPDFARAIMTTDTRPKLRSATGRVGGVEVTVAGACKGAGMIHPDMATMLAFVTTDAVVGDLSRLWREICGRTFNAISIDGDTSTNDTALVLASGVAGNRADDDALADLLESVASELARDIVRDAEGGTKTVAVTVAGAPSLADAKRAAHAIATSPLVKTALHGEDPNWGRIVAAAGRSGCAFEPERVSLHIGDVPIYERGRWLGPSTEAAAHAVMKTPEYGLVGDARHTVYTCDFSADYVRINADYRS